MGENEKLLGDFIRKYNIRDKLFGRYTQDVNARNYVLLTLNS